MSSANKCFAPGDRGTSEMSFIYNSDSSRRSTDPCGTPDLTGSQVEEHPLKTTRWKWFDKEQIIQRKMIDGF